MTSVCFKSIQEQNMHEVGLLFVIPVDFELLAHLSLG